MCPPAPRIQSLARSHGTGGAGGKSREERRLLLHEGTGQDFLGGRGPQFLPLEGRPLPLLAAWKLASTKAGRRPAAVSPVFAKNWREEREAQAVDRKGKKRAPALKHLALSSGAQGNLAPRASAFPGARSGENAAVARSPLCF